jgi:DNA (cytosine-5)-methyltransferase 1
MNNYVFKKYQEFINKNGYVPSMFNPYNCIEIQGIAPTLSTYCGSTTSSATVLIKEKEMDNLRIRKLTPKECWRLIGFDDEDFEKAEKANSNTQLYKQAGNSIVVPVLEYIIKGLFDCGALIKENTKQISFNDAKSFDEIVKQCKKG